MNSFYVIVVKNQQIILLKNRYSQKSNTYQSLMLSRHEGGKQDMVPLIFFLGCTDREKLKDKHGRKLFAKRQSDDVFF